MIDFTSSGALRGSGNRAQQQLCVRPRLEALEDRCTPADFFVNTTADTPDVAPGDGKAEDAAGDTSLRAAIMEGNVLVDGQISHVVWLDGVGEPPVTFSLQSALPTMVKNFSFIGAYNETGNLVTVSRGAGAAQFRLFDVGAGASVSFGSIDITGGSDKNGAGIRNLGSVRLNSCRVYDNKTLPGGSGGGIYSDGELLRIEDSTVDNNVADGGRGGGVYSSGNLYVYYSKIDKNTSGSHGGGVYATNGIVQFEVTTISQNTAQAGNGGGLCSAADNRLTMNEGDIWGNTAGRDGGGIWHGDSLESCDILSTYIDLNQANEEGGGIYLKNAPMYLEYTSVWLNNADSDGGGIYQESGDLSSYELYVTDNTAGGWGGGFFILGGTVALDLLLTENTAADIDGGAVCQGVTVNYMNLHWGSQSVIYNVVP